MKQWLTKRKKKNGFIEANVEKKIFFDSKCGIFGDSWEEVCNNYNGTPDNAANDMHDKVVSELIDKIKKQYNFETIREKHDNVVQEMYCKGIDDLTEKIKQDAICITFGLRSCDIDRIAEELKEQNK